MSAEFDDSEYKAPSVVRRPYELLQSARPPKRLNRFLIRDALSKLRVADIEIFRQVPFLQGLRRATTSTFSSHLDANSSTERKFIDHLYHSGLRLPDACPETAFPASTASRTSGTLHASGSFATDHPMIRLAGARKRDAELRQLIIARGDEVWSWHYREDLSDAKIAHRPDVFRKVR